MKMVKLILYEALLFRFMCYKYNSVLVIHVQVYPNVGKPVLIITICHCIHKCIHWLLNKNYNHKEVLEETPFNHAMIVNTALYSLSATCLWNATKRQRINEVMLLP